MTAPSLVGKLLGGRYEVTRELARGGMGAVLDAHDRALDRRVAIKAALSDTPQARLRFIDEAQVTGRLGHPSIVSVFELGADGERPFLVMKFVAGRTLAQVAKEPLEGDALRRRLRLFLRVAEAVAYAHERGVIHRDLKPANVMVGADEEVLVLDWGLARPFDRRRPAGTPTVRSDVREALARGELLGLPGARSGDLTIEGAVVGTPAYMPPEQADGSTLDARADVYSLGATLYELLGGGAPFSGPAHEVFAALFQRPPRPLAEVAPAVPPPVVAIVERAMARDLEARYPDARALALDVEAFLDERPVSCWREPRGAAARRLARRHRGALSLAALGLVLVLGGGLGASRVVASEQEATRALEGTAARLGEEAAVASRQAVAAARLEAAAGAALDALRACVAAHDVARRALPLAEIEAAHGAARAALRSAREAVADPAVRDATIASLTTALDDARRRADLALAHALVARAPAASLERLRALRDADPVLAPDLTLLLARALVRSNHPREARDALAALVAPDGRDDLRAAARALELVLAEAPHAERVRAWDAVVTAAPRAGWARLGLAEARAGAGDLEGAEDDYDRAQRLDPADPWIAVSRIDRTTPPCRDWVVVAGILDTVPVLTDELPAAAKPVQVTMLWRGVVPWELPPTDLRALARETDLDAAPLDVAAVVGLRRARVMGRPDVALAIAYALVTRLPHHREGVGTMAWALARLGRWDEVVTLTTEELGRYPEDPDLHLALGLELWHRRRRPAGAAPHLALAARSSLDAARWVELAVCLLAAGAPEQALEAARRAAALDPGADEAHAEHVELPPHDPSIPLILGDALAATGDPARAALLHLAAWQRSQLEEGLQPVGLLEAGADHEALGLLEEAKELYWQAMRVRDLAEEATARYRRLGGQ